MKLVESLIGWEVTVGQGSEWEQMQSLFCLWFTRDPYKIHATSFPLYQICVFSKEAIQLLKCLVFLG